MKHRYHRRPVAAAPALGGHRRSAQTKEINFGIISTESSRQPEERLAAAARRHAEGHRPKVNAFFATDYAGIIEGMRFNKVQVAWFGNKSGMEAVDRASGEVFAQIVGKRRHRGLLLAADRAQGQPAASRSTTCSSSGKNLTLGFGDPNSTSGSLVPGYYVFAQNKRRPEEGLQAHRARQPRDQPAGRGQQAGRRGHQQQREPWTSSKHDRPEKAKQRARDLELAADRQRPDGLAQGPATRPPRPRCATSCSPTARRDREQGDPAEHRLQRASARRPTRS